MFYLTKTEKWAGIFLALAKIFQKSSTHNQNKSSTNKTF